VTKGTQIEISTLRRAFELLLQHVETVHGPQVTLDADYFWSIPREHIYDVLTTPSDLTVGQLSESLANLEAMLDDPEGAISYGLVWLADVTKAIGHAVVK
jgi:hypothetical protein